MDSDTDRLENEGFTFLSAARSFDSFAVHFNKRFAIDEMLESLTSSFSLSFVVQDIRALHLVIILPLLLQDEHGAPTGNQNWTVVTIGVLDADDLPPKFSQYLYEALIEVDTPQVRAMIAVYSVHLSNHNCKT